MFSILRRIYKSISFVTVLIALGFGILAVLLTLYPTDFLDDYPRIAIKDPESIKFILSFTIGGIFTLTVFSYTMVMNVLNRSISNYSPRLIPLILHERHHQIILGATSGTIIYSSIMAVFISSDAKIEFPSIAAPLAVLMVITCVFLFVYFIHSVSQSIHVNYIVHRSFMNTKKSIEKILALKAGLRLLKIDEGHWPEEIHFDSCGYLNKIRINKLIDISEKHKVEFKLAQKMGTFVQEGKPVLLSSKPLNSKLQKKVKNCISLDRSEPIDVVEVGFKHLVEVAVKASSPAINDPGTSLIAVDYLVQLFIFRRKVPDFDSYTSEKGGRIFFEMVPISMLQDYAFKEMEAFMDEDPILKEKLIYSKALLAKDK